MSKQPYDAAIKLIAIHTAMKKKYSANYLNTITPYAEIIIQVKEANQVSTWESLRMVNASKLVQPKKADDPKKQSLFNALALEKQQLFISAAHYIEGL